MEFVLVLHSLILTNSKGIHVTTSSMIYYSKFLYYFLVISLNNLSDNINCDIINFSNVILIFKLLKYITLSIITRGYTYEGNTSINHHKITPYISCYYQCIFCNI